MPPQAVVVEATPPSPQATARVQRLVAIGDLHGDSAAAQAVLQLAGLVDESGHWAGGDTVLVQTGDTTDRGPDSRGVLDLLRRLSDEAVAAGGRVVPLLGNHETMNLLGDWRYVSAEDLLGFGGEAARREALGATGEYGQWLRGRDTVALIDGTVFVHGGVTPAFAKHGVDAMNAAVRDAVIAGDRSAQVIGADGPLWYRGYVQDPPSDACPRLDQALASLGAQRMVVGHTTRRNGRVEVRCGGRLTVIDTGISAHYGGHLAAWVADSGDAAVLYPSGRVDLEDPS
ncbi:MAG: 3',5'-cyclic AMP phosphodiesterase CpdA [Myxococcota bacterium]|jgi:3',5'-cyclic AMP phosphodiesterase CpdA